MHRRDVCKRWLVLKLEWVAFGGSEVPITKNVQEGSHEVRQDGPNKHSNPLLL